MFNVIFKVMIACLSLDDGVIEFSVLISPSFFGMSLLMETLVLISSPSLHDGLTWKSEYSVERIMI